MSNQVVRQVFEVNQSGQLPNTRGGIRVTCSADFLLHTIATNHDSGGRMGYVVIGPVADSGVMFDYLAFHVPALPTALDVSLGCTAAKAGEALVVRGKTEDESAGAAKIALVLMVITEAGAAVSFTNEPVPHWTPAEPIDGALLHRPRHIP